MTKALILKEALELFTSKGYEGTSMDDIAKAVGIRKASLYSHFTGKESIFSAIFVDILVEYTDYVDKLTNVDETDDVVDHLKRIFTDFILYCHNNLKMYFWDRYFYYPPDFLASYIRERTYETQQVFIDRICMLLEKGIRDKKIKNLPVRDLALSYYYLMIGISMSVKMYEEAELRQDIEHALNGLIQGFIVSE